MKGYLIDQLLIQNPEEWANVQYLLELASPKLVPGNSQFVVTIGKKGLEIKEFQTWKMLIFNLEFNI